MLNLINLLISRAVDRLIDLVNLNDVREVAIDRIACNAREDDIVEGVVNHPRVAREFHNISSRAVAKHVDLGDLAGEIDLSDLAGNLDHGDVAGNIDITDIAGEIDLGDLAGEIDLGEIAEHLDYAKVAAALDVDRLSDAVYTRVCVPEIDGLEARINEATSQAVANALDAANRRTEPVAPVIEQSPDLIARLLDLAVEKLLARADEAAKNGEV